MIITFVKEALVYTKDERQSDVKYVQAWNM